MVKKDALQALSLIGKAKHILNKIENISLSDENEEFQLLLYTDATIDYSHRFYLKCDGDKIKLHYEIETKYNNSKKSYVLASTNLDDKSFNKSLISQINVKDIAKEIL